jgi:hypothetical protein
MSARFRLFILPIILIAAACSRMGDVTGPHASSAISLRPMFSSIVGNGTSPSPAGLRACYAGEGNGSEVISHADGAVQGAVSFVPGKFGQAFSFDALGGIVSTPANPLLDVGPGPGLTMAVWFYSKGPAFGLDFGAGPMMEFNGGAQLWQYSEQHSYDGLYTNMAQSNTVFSQLTLQHGVLWNQWNHGAVTWDKASGHMALYLNGDLVMTKDTASFSPSTSGNFNIGGRQNGSFTGGTISFNGMLDEVQIYDHALTGAEIMQVASATGTMCVSPPTQYKVVQQPVSSGESGVPFTTQPVVELLDASGNVVLNGVTPVTATLTGTGTLTGTTTVNAVNGVATFTNLAIAGNASATLTFTATTLPVATGSSATSPTLTTVQVARQIAIATQPGGAITGSNLNPQPAVRILDAAGLLMPTATNPITAVLNSGLGTIGGTATVNAAGGVATFSSLKVNGIGAFTLGFTSPGLTSAVSTPFITTPLPATQLLVSGQPSGAESGVPFTAQPVVELLDATNNIVVGATNTVTVSIASGTGTLSGATTVSALGGVATFTDLKIAGSGPVTLAFSAGAPLTATSSSFAVIQVVRQLVLITPPGNTITSGLVVTPAPVVELRDAAGLKVTTATDAVTATAPALLGILSGTTTVNAVGGTATFNNLIITNLLGGSGALNFALASSPLLGVASPPLQIVTLPAFGTPTKLVITTQPGSAESGVTFATQPVVEIRDANGNKVANSTASVTVSLYSGAGTLSGTKTVNAVAGIATFTDLKISGGGSATLKFSSTNLTGATGNSFTVTQVAHFLVITRQPAASTSGSVLSNVPEVEIHDAAGLAIMNGATITASLASGTGTLSGNTTESVDGDADADFDQLTVTGTGNFTLKFTYGSLSVVSNSFAVTAVVATPTAVVRHAPTLNARIDGSLQMLLGENVTLNGNAAVTGKLYVPGLPTVRLNGNPSLGATVDGQGSASPSNYTVTLNGGSSLGTLVRRTDPGIMPTVAAPATPAGTRTVSLNSSSDAIGTWATVRNLTLNGNVGTVTVPAGAYGDITLNGSNKIVLGVTGATTPSRYDLQHLTLNGSSSIQVVGPVILTVGNAVSLNGAMGAATNPEWLTFNIAQGGLTLNGNVALSALVLAPNGTVTVNGGSSLTGALAADRLVVNGNALVKITTAVPTP